MFTTKIRRLAIFVSLLLILLLSVKAEAADYQLIRHDTKMSCVDAQTGTAITSQFITYKGYTYYFDANGFAHTGWLRLGKNYYFFNADGSMIKNQWMNQYYFLADGRMAKNRWIKKCYVGSDGRVIPGYRKRLKEKFVNTKQGKKYRNSDGSYVTQAWQCIKGYWYYFYSSGLMAHNSQIGKYYVDRQGRMVVKKWVRIGKRKYYYGTDGRLRKIQKLQTGTKKKEV